MDVIEIKFRKIVLDFILCNIVGWPNVWLGHYGTPFRRGIFCDDDTIRYPVKDGTVTFPLLLLIGFGVNFVGMLITEFIRRSAHPKYILVHKQKVPFWIFKFYEAFGMFCFGDLILWGITDFIKYTIGRLRPHYYFACLPIVCLGRNTPNEYIVDFECKNSEPKELRLSFPSGHSSFYIYTMVYFAIYLHVRMNWDGSKLLKHVLQYLAVLSAFIVGMTRVSDYKHHWSDVLAGLALGCLTAVIVTRYFSNLFVKEPLQQKISEEVVVND